MTAYYNEIDPKAAAWLRVLIAEGHIAPGIVDERSIEDIKPDEIKEYTQCHFFAGVGVWSYALRKAGWPDSRPVWTGSCPCQPFSAAGKGAGFTDERHLWPAWFHLITQCEPVHIYGEQVASKDGLGWLDLVQTDLENADYTSGATDLCAAGVGAPHIRQRLWFVAERLADTDGRDARTEWQQRSGQQRQQSADCGSGRLADTEREQRVRRRAGETGNEPGTQQRTERLCDADRPGPTNGFWRSADWLYCRDGKWPPVEPGTSPLASGASARVVRLRGYGNAINAEAAATFISATIDSLDNTKIY